MDRLSRSAALALALAACLASAARAGGPTMEVQGTLADALGKPLSGSVALEFTLVDLRDGSREVWTETQHVRVDDGRFAAVLGETEPLPPLSGLRSGWRLTAEAPMYSRWKVTVTEFQRQTAARRRQWAELMEHFSDEDASAPAPAPAAPDRRPAPQGGAVLSTRIFPALSRQAQVGPSPLESPVAEPDPASDPNERKRRKALERVLAREASLIRANLGRLAGDYRERRYKSTPMRLPAVHALPAR